RTAGAKLGCPFEHGHLGAGPLQTHGRREPADSGSDDGDPHMVIVPRPCAAGDRLIRSLEVFGAGLGEEVAGDPALLAEADGRLLDAPPAPRRPPPPRPALLAPPGILAESVGGEPDPVLRIIGGAAGFVVGALRIELRDVLVVDGLEGVGGTAD